MFLSKERRGGMYYLFYFDEDGKRRKVSTKTKRKSEAFKFYREFEQSQKASKIVRLSRFADEFLESIKESHSEKSKVMFRLVLRTFHRQPIRFPTCPAPRFVNVVKIRISQGGVQILRQGEIKRTLRKTKE